MGADGWRHARKQAEAARWLALAAFGSSNGIGIGSGSGGNCNSGASSQTPTPSGNGSGNGSAAVPASASHADARYQLGLLFADGRGVRQSHGTATHCFRLAVEQARIGGIFLTQARGQ
jgi:TPR repeat protein